MSEANFWKISLLSCIGFCLLAYTNGDVCTVTAVCPFQGISNNTNDSITLNCSFVDIGNNSIPPKPQLGDQIFYINYQCEGSADTYSTGSVLTIIFFTCAFAYLGIGVAVNFFLLGARGAEVIPNLSFWKDFPALVKDGAKYLQNGCTARPSELTTTTADGYDAI